MIKRVIVRDYNGHYRLDQADLDELHKSWERLQEIASLKERVKYLERACRNLDQANQEIGNELLETRWKLIAAERRIEELERLDVDWEVVRDDEARG